MKTFVQYIEEKLLINKDFKGIDYEMRRLIDEIFNEKKVKDVKYNDEGVVWIFTIGEENYKKTIDIIRQHCDSTNEKIFVTKKDEENGKDLFCMKKQDNFIAVLINNVQHEYPAVTMVYNDEFSLFLVSTGVCGYLKTKYENNLTKVTFLNDDNSIEAYDISFDLVENVRYNLNMRIR